MGNRNALLFAAGKLKSAPRPYLVAVRQSFYEIMNSSHLRRGLHFLSRRIGSTVGDVIEDRIVKEDRIWGTIPMHREGSIARHLERLIVNLNFPADTS